MKTIAIRLVILAVLAGAGYSAWKFFQQMPARQVQVPYQGQEE
ncbi:MAG: hypothetical protein WKF37_09550 [Bryobacteraceae bacterium]